MLFLMRRRDGEGCAALHLGAQFGHTSIVGYLIAKGQAVNTQDQNGMTALMWAAYRTSALDPVRLLTTLGSSLGMADSVQGNTALHWALSAKNSTGTSILVTKGLGTGVLGQTNTAGETPACVLARVSRSGAGAGVVHWLPAKVRARLQDQGERKSRNALKRVTENKRFREVSMLCMPALVIWGIGSTLELGVDYLVKLGLFTLLYIFVNGVSILTFDDRLMSFLPLGIYLSTKLWIYYTWFSYITQVVSPLVTVLFVLASTGLWYNFLQV